MDRIDLARIPLHARRRAATLIESSPHLLTVLASDPDADVRLAVAGHPATPLTTLRGLAGDGVPRVAALAGIRAAAQEMVGEPVPG